jgi:hypothetical protein
MRRHSVVPALLGVLAVLAACDHAQPFGATDLGPNQPFSAAFPRQLTFSTLGDVQPAWLADGSGIVYSFATGRADRDRCLGVLPAQGGRRVREICHHPQLDGDSINALWAPAVGPGGALAYVRESASLLINGVAPHSRELVVASMADPDPGRVVLRFPYTAPDGQLHDDATDLHWLSDSGLVFLAEHLTYSFPPYPVDTLYTPLEIVRLDLVGDSTALTVVPGTADATSVAADTTGTIYYTLTGDSRVYRLAPGAGSADTLYDFGAAGAASGVQVRGDVLVATAGGVLYRVHLTAQIAVPFAVPQGQDVSFPALSPDDARLVVEARPVGTDAPPDLWLLEVP